MAARGECKIGRQLDIFSRLSHSRPRVSHFERTCRLRLFAFRFEQNDRHAKLLKPIEISRQFGKQRTFAYQLLTILTVILAPSERPDELRSWPKKFGI
jgi:hypothetical protein